MGPPNDVGFCPVFALRCCLSGGLDTATRNCLDSCRWAFGGRAVVGSGVRGRGRGVW
jgi:hypothetical protein